MCLWLKQIIAQRFTSAHGFVCGCQVLQQAGQVWFPDSAFKTAQAISDFNCERLPLMVFANWRGFSGGMKGIGWILNFAESLYYMLDVAEYKYSVSLHFALRYVWPDIEVWGLYCGHAARFPSAGAGLHPTTGWAKRRLMGGDRPHHQPTVYGALCRPGEQVHEEVIFFKRLLYGVPT